MVDFCKVKIVTDVEKLNIFNISFREVNKLAWSIFKHPETNSEHCIKFYVLVSFVESQFGYIVALNLLPISVMWVLLFIQRRHFFFLMLSWKIIVISLCKET